jgi:hypothetical protein
MSNQENKQLKTSQGLQWLLALLELQRSNSWDMPITARLWTPTLFQHRIAVILVLILVTTGFPLQSLEEGKHLTKLRSMKSKMTNQS